MPPFDQQKWIQQAKEVAAQPLNTSTGHPFAISILTACYGPSSQQLRAFVQTCEHIYKEKNDTNLRIFLHSRRTIENTIRELENGLVSNLRAAVAGELLGDFVSFAREALSQNTEDSKNVAAVLAAAAFEDCLRRLGAEKANIQARPKLLDVLTALKDADIIRGGQVTLAQAQLKFRNDSLHADWKEVDRAQVESCLALVDSLLIAHFS